MLNYTHYFEMYMGDIEMEASHCRNHKRTAIVAAVFFIINILAVFIIIQRENRFISSSLSSHGEETRNRFEAVMDHYERSFHLFVQMMQREVQNNPDPDDIQDYLKSMDTTLLGIEGDTYDGLYMYYQGRYLYSWDTPYSVYEDSGYVATERPWYKDAAAGKGMAVFTPPYMSYANHYILTTISQLQPDGETVFAYDIKMGDIQNLVASMNYYENEQIMIYDRNGTVIGSTNENYLGGNLQASAEEAEKAVADAESELQSIDPAEKEEISKAEDKVRSAAAFYEFQKDFSNEFKKVKASEFINGKNRAVFVSIGGKRYYAILNQGEEFNFLVFVPVLSAYKGTLNIWLVPLLLMELWLIYIFGRISRERKNHELREAYVELGQTQRRLEIALTAAQKAAAVDELTGMMNFRSFTKGMAEILNSMGPEDRGILIMIDGDHFKSINDNYGHSTGDEVIKLTAQMIVGRIRTVDLASRLHGDEFAIFISNTSDYSVARRIMEDINQTLAKEAKRRNMPSITLSAGAVIAKKGDTYSNLSKAADAVLYEAKKSHNGGFAY